MKVGSSMAICERMQRHFVAQFVERRVQVKAGRQRDIEIERPSDRGVTHRWHRLTTGEMLVVADVTVRRAVRHKKNKWERVRRTRVVGIKRRREGHTEREGQREIERTHVVFALISVQPLGPPWAWRRWLSQAM